MSKPLPIPGGAGKVALVTGAGRRRAGARREVRVAVAMRRPAQPGEIAPAYVFLASPQCSSFITGAILPVVGGYG